MRSVVVSENKAKRSWNGRLSWLPVPLFTALRRLSSSDSHQTQQNLGDSDGASKPRPYSAHAAEDIPVTFFGERLRQWDTP
jgi:hypothetical protein